ncbi:hypothetical protein D3C76_1360810 [compost metagenome]
MQGGPGEYAEGVAVAQQPRRETENPGVGQHAESAKQHDAGNGNGDLIVARPHHPRAGEDRRGAADGVAGTDQDGRLALHAQNAHTQPDGQGQRGQDQQHIDDEGLHTERLHLLHGETKAVQRHADAQQ